MPIVPIFGTGYKGKSPAITDQRRLNCYVEQYGQDADKTQLALIGRPGNTRIGLSQSGPIRGFSEQFTTGIAGGFADFIACAHGTQFETFSPGTGANLTGVTLFRTSTGPVYWAFNGTQLMAVDGLTGYVVNSSTLATTVLQDFPAVNFPAGAASICFIASRFVCPDPSVNGRFRWSAINDGTSWASLDFANAESAADPLRYVLQSNGELLLMGRDTIEFWAPVTDTRVFARVGGAGIDWGISALNSVQNINGGTCFVGRSRSGGERQAIFLNGHIANPISSPDVTAAINSSSAPDSATGCAYVIGGHPFYALNLPETTWVFDFQNGTWDEANTDGGRWSVDRVQPAFGLIVAGDYRDGRIYKLDVTNFTDDSNPLITEIISKHILSDYEYVSIRELFADCETGVGLVGAFPQPTSFALSFNGTNQSVSIPDAPQLATGQQQTIQFWIQIPIQAGAINLNAVMSEKWANAQASWTMNFQGSGRTFEIDIAATVNDSFGTNGFQYRSGVTQLFDGFWHHVAFVFDGTQPVPANRVALYTDGALVTPFAVLGTCPNILQTSTAPVTICNGFAASGTGAFRAIIDEYQVWNFARTQAQIASTRFMPAIGSEVGLVALYHFDEGTGTVSTADSSTFHNTASLGNAPAWVNDTNAFFYNPITGVSPQIMLQTSHDGGRTWGNEVWQSMGSAGSFRTRARWLNLGMARDIVIKLRMSDPTKRVLTNAAMQVT